MKRLNINFDFIKVLSRRDLRLYFTNPSGYVFITLFIFLSAAAAFWQERFFLNNLANLDQLNDVFPYLLLFFVPALTMGIWANERVESTDELLLTLPATDLEIVLGKYLAALGIYTASLVLSLSHIIVLMFLGSPDIGLMLSNYFGYWLIGGAFIAVGMLASLLSANMTIAFILGGLMCSLFVFIDTIFGIFGDTIRDLLSPLGVFIHSGDFARGIVSFSGLLYFLSFTGVMLYLNVLLIGRRHWLLEADGHKMSVHYTVRTISIVIAMISIGVILSRASIRLDITAEQLHSLSSETERLLDELPDDRPVFIQAYISKEAPQQFVQTRSNLLGFLKEIDAIGGSRVEVLIYDTEPYTDEAKDAREKFGILPREVQESSSARAGISQVFMGVAFTCGAEESVIPFFDRGLPVEYELVRSIRMVVRTTRKKIGVLVTDAKIFGGFDFQTMQTTPAWSVVEEVKKQYEVVRISANAPITEELEGLLVPMPSTLPQEEMDNLLNFIKEGTPTLLLVDPLPVINIGISPSEKSGGNRNPFMQNQGPPPKPKGNISGFMNELGIRWSTAQVIWDAYNPHPDLANLPPEVVFVGKGNENPESFNKESQTTSELQELVFLFPGNVNKASGSGFEFQPLLKSSMVSGTQSYQNMVQRNFLGMTQLVTRGLPHYPSRVDYILAAHVQGEISPPDTTVPDTEGIAKNLNVVIIADIDFISEQFFQIRKQGVQNLNFDNVSFFLNCMDVLIDDDSFISLRNRRVKHRTLESVEAQVQENIQQRANEEQQAESEAQVALSEAQRRLSERVNELRQRTDLDEQTKRIMAQNLQEVENRKFETLKANIEAEKNAKVAASKERMESRVRTLQSNIKTFAVLMPPIPVFVMGIVIFLRRRRREAEGAAAARRLRS